MGQKAFTIEGKLEERIISIIRNGHYSFVPASIQLGRQSRRIVSGMPLAELPNGRIACLGIYKRNHWCGSVYYSITNSKIIEQDTKSQAEGYEKRGGLSEVPERLLLAVKEAIQDTSGLGYAYSYKSNQLSKSKV